MRKHVVGMLLAGLLLLCAQVAFAEKQQIIDPNYDFGAAKRIVVMEPNYSQPKEGPSAEDAYAAIALGSEKLNLEVLTVQDIKNQILNRQPNVEVTRDILNEQIAQTADLYVVPTVLEKAKTLVYFEVYSAKTQKMLYSEYFYTRTTKDAEMFKKLTAEFCGVFNDVLAGKPAKKKA